MYKLLILVGMLLYCPLYSQTPQRTLCGNCKVIKQRGKKRNFKNLKQLFQHLEFVPITSTRLNPELVEILDLSRILPANQFLFFDAVVMDRNGEFWENGNGLTTGDQLSFKMVTAAEEMAVHSYYVYLYNNSQAALLTFVPGEEVRMQLLE